MRGALQRGLASLGVLCLVLHPVVRTENLKGAVRVRTQDACVPNEVTSAASCGAVDGKRWSAPENLEAPNTSSPRLDLVGCVRLGLRRSAVVAVMQSAKHVVRTDSAGRGRFD
jgi:hypothetical protein